MDALDLAATPFAKATASLSAGSTASFRSHSPRDPDSPVPSPPPPVRGRSDASDPTSTTRSACAERFRYVALLPALLATRDSASTARVIARRTAFGCALIHVASGSNRPSNRPRASARSAAAAKASRVCCRVGLGILDAAMEDGGPPDAVCAMPVMSGRWPGGRSRSSALSADWRSAPVSLLAGSPAVLSAPVLSTPAAAPTPINDITALTLAPTADAASTGLRAPTTEGSCLPAGPAPGARSGLCSLETSACATAALATGVIATFSFFCSSAMALAQPAATSLRLVSVRSRASFARLSASKSSGRFVGIAAGLTATTRSSRGTYLGRRLPSAIVPSASGVGAPVERFLVATWNARRTSPPLCLASHLASRRGMPSASAVLASDSAEVSLAACSSASSSTSRFFQSIPPQLAQSPSSAASSSSESSSAMRRAAARIASFPLCAMATRP
mmetsp:Transcript_5771/g.23699  ORF Transcript_5771/g.23699 Transcript_5771/m.23699 type:complete len:448 (-) Transcript_5771:51-1394(-)